MFSRIPRARVVLATATLAVWMASISALSGVNGPRLREFGAQGGRERTLYVNVTDRSGTPVTDLGPQELVIREDGARREVLRLSRAVEPIDIAILVDDSAAMEAHLTHMRDGLTGFAEQMHRDHNIAVIGLGSRPTIFTDYTRNLAQIKTAIGRAFPQSDSGMTLLDALVEVSRGLEKRETPRAVLLAVLSDGPEYGRFDDRAVIKAIEKAGAALYAVTVGAFAASTPDEVRYRALVLANGTRRTGGRHDNLMVSSGLPKAIEKVALDLSSQLKVVYSRPESLVPPESVEVRVTRPGLTARATPARRPGTPPGGQP